MTTTSAQFIAARRAAYHLSAATFGEMKLAIDNQSDVRPLEFGARGLARWARVIPAMFPAGTGVPASNVKPAVWTERQDFERIAGEYETAAKKLAELAKADDRPGFARQWQATREVCSACHERFRAPASQGH